MAMDRVQTDGTRGNEAGEKEIKNGEEHQSKQGMKTRQERRGEKYVKLKGGRKMSDNQRKAKGRLKASCFNGSACRMAEQCLKPPHPPFLPR